MAQSFLPILVLFGVASVFAAIFLILSSLIGPKNPNASKLDVYECGLNPVRSARERVSVKFFLVAILFILFDVEVVFILPWAILYKQFIQEGQGMFMLVEMAIFLVILVVGYVYVWRKGALDWK